MREKKEWFWVAPEAAQWYRAWLFGCCGSSPGEGVFLEHLGGIEHRPFRGLENRDEVCSDESTNRSSSGDRPSFDRKRDLFRTRTFVAAGEALASAFERRNAPSQHLQQAKGFFSLSRSFVRRPTAFVGHRPLWPSVQGPIGTRDGLLRTGASLRESN